MNAFCPIGVMDSGIGGLTLLECMRAQLPHENFVYFADSAFAPYGDLSTDQVAERVHAVTQRLLFYRCKAIVIACNTATNVGIAKLRSRYDMIFVGAEPAIKPAIEAGCRRILVLVTPTTATQPMFLRLVDRFDPQRLVVSPQRELAMLIERGQRDAVRQCLEHIRDQHRDCDACVLGCTHYIFARQMLADLWEGVQIFDGNQGATRRLVQLLREHSLLAPRLHDGNTSYLHSQSNF